MFYPKQKKQHTETKRRKREEGAISLFACVRAQGKSLFPCRLCLCAGWAATCRVTGAGSGWPSARSAFRFAATERYAASSCCWCCRPRRSGYTITHVAKDDTHAQRLTTLRPSWKYARTTFSVGCTRRSAVCAWRKSPLPRLCPLCCACITENAPQRKNERGKKDEGKGEEEEPTVFLELFCFPFFFFVFESCARREGVCEDR